MTTMTDDQLDAMLVRFLDAQAETIGARARGELTTAEIIRRRVTAASAGRSWMLLVAALLLTGAAALGLTVGAATLREQARTSLDPALDGAPIYAANACDSRAPDSWVVDASWQDVQGHWVSLTVHDDGSVLSRVETASDRFGPLMARKLTSDGVARVEAAIAESLYGPGGCAAVKVPGTRPHVVIARVDGQHFGLRWGEPDDPEGQPLTSSQEETVTTLGERIEDLGAWLPASSWVDSVERPYTSEWLVDVQQLWRGEPGPVGPDPSRVLFEGAAILQFGHPAIGSPAGPPTASTSQAPERCQVVGAEAADRIRQTLVDSDALPPTNERYGWRYTVPGPEGFDVAVQLVPLRPDQVECLDSQADLHATGPVAPAPTPEPATPSMPETPRTDLTLVCSWLDLTWPRPVSPRTLFHEACRR